MTPAEYVQLKAFARIDGARLAALWVVSFACYVIGISNPLYGVVAMALMIATPFFVSLRVMKFRDKGLGGVISFGRAWGYSLYMFFYASILLALAQYVYFAYIDHGYMLHSFSEALSSSEAQQMVKQYGAQQMVQESLEQLGQMRPIDYALNILTMNIMIGAVLGLPIAALIKKLK